MTRVYRLIPALALLLAAACGKDSPATPTTPTTPNTPTTPTTTNRAPSIGSMSVSPAFGISGLTTFTFVAAATDPDNDVLAYGWSFSGGAANGASTSGTPTGDGATTIQLTVSDGRGNAVSDSRSVTLGTMTGNWDFVVDGICGSDPREKPAVFTLTQSGGTVTGSLAFPGNWCAVNPGTHSEIPASTPGTIDAQGNFALPRIAVGNFIDVRLDNAKMDGTGRKITGRVFNSGFTGEPFTMTKQ